MARTTSFGRFLLAALALAVTGGRAQGTESPFAAEIVDFQPGTGAVPGYDLPESTLGEPTRTTGGTLFTEAVTPFQPAWLPEEIVSLGIGGSITLAFDHEVLDEPGNPFGIDLLVFGNAFCTDPSYPQGVCGGSYSEGGRIEVSLDGVDWRTVPKVSADAPFPTIGWLDTGPYDTSPGTNPTDFTRPVDPSMSTQIVGRSHEAILEMYDGSGGGAGIDLGTVGLSAIRFVRISNDGADFTPEVDAIADVSADGANPGDPDLDGNGIVGGGDLGLLLVAWGSEDARADLDGNGLVDGPDLGLLLAAWGT